MKLVAIEKIDTAVLRNQTIHHTTIGRRNQLSRSSTLANSITNTSAQNRFTSGTRQPARSAHRPRITALVMRERGGPPRDQPVGEQDQTVDDHEQRTTLTSTPNHVAANATALFNNTDLLTMSSA